ncbi:endolytic transglycosylase MltG [Priestia megaterium]|nr:endolytic transglycosylase MltG [Priestia megaterium]
MESRRPRQMNNITIRAFSIGLLTATSILGAVYYAQENKKSAVDESISEKDVIAYAQENNYVLISQKDYSKLKNTKQTDHAPSPREVTISITQGMTSIDIANVLLKHGIIKDTKEFDKLVKQEKLSTQFQVGTYTLTPTMSLKQIVKTLTE